MGDLVAYRRVEVFESQAEGQTCRLLQRSMEHPSKPEQPGLVRLESIITGYVFHKPPNSSTTRIFVALMVDPRGYVPKWIVNHMASKKAQDWCTALYRACMQTQASEDPAMPGRVRQCVERFSNNVCA